MGFTSRFEGRVYTIAGGPLIIPLNTTPYFELFPTASITFQKSDDHAFSLNYGRRISRPYYNQLNPFRQYLNPNAYFEGNPSLQPSFTNSIKLSHIYKGFPIISLSYDHTTNWIGDIGSDNNGNQVLTFQNFRNKSNYELSTLSAFYPFKWLENTNMFTLWHIMVNSASPQTQVNAKGWGAYFYTNNSISFNQAKTISGDVTFMYIFPSQDAIYRWKAMVSLDLGLKVAATKKIQIALNATDILKSRKYAIDMFVNQINQQALFRPDNSYKISISYKFGNSKIKQDENQRRVEDDDRTKKKSGMGM